MSCVIFACVGKTKRYEFMFSMLKEVYLDIFVRKFVLTHIDRIEQVPLVQYSDPCLFFPISLQVCELIGGFSNISKSRAKSQELDVVICHLRVRCTNTAGDRKFNRTFTFGECREKCVKTKKSKISTTGTIGCRENECLIFISLLL